MISYYTGAIRFELPSHLGGGKFLYHLSCLLRLGKNDESIILEYDNYIHYVYDPEKEGGLRFRKMDFNGYWNKIYNGKKGAIIIIDLIIGNKMTLSDLLWECKLLISWTANDYN